VPRKKRVSIGVTFSSEFLKRLDAIVRECGYASRRELVREAVRRLVEEKWRAIREERRVERLMRLLRKGLV